MREGYLSKYFEAVAAKHITEGEAGLGKCNQHEFNGVAELKKMFGTERKTFKTRFLYVTDNEAGYLTETGTMTWYDARSNHPLRSEYRLYFSTTGVSLNFKTRDLIIICKLKDNTVMLIAVQNGSTMENQILWLFGITPGTTETFAVKDIDRQTKSDYVTQFILEELGIETEKPDENYLELMLRKFGGNFPKSEVMSEMARTLCKDINPVIEPDNAIIEWMQKERLLFTTLEHHIISGKLKEGFGNSKDTVNEFLKFSLSVQNRRKARAGYALENHLQAIFNNHNIKFSRGGITENKSRPDFIFPGIEYYHKPDFDSGLLTMLGVKTSCKDRWRQVLNEAQKIGHKHLFTMEPAISVNQTGEMQANNLQLVVPSQIHDTFSLGQRKRLINLQDFITVVRGRNRAAGLRDSI